MRSTFSLLPYINRSKVKADGTTAVLCRITIDGKQTVISTGIYCRPEDWNGKKNEILALFQIRLVGLTEIFRHFFKGNVLFPERREIVNQVLLVIH